MPNTVYQATVTALEALLPPRVVSRALQEGLQALTKTPATLQYADVDKILKVQVYRQLQVVMPVTEAKMKLQHVLDKLKKMSFEPDSTPAPENKPSQEAALGELRARLKPFNLYFEWPEVQKLRAQLQLLETEQSAGREAGRLVEEARQGLATVEQKLTDQLVHQAKALGELSASLETVKFLGGPKVRRLENLLGQVHMAQQAHSLAPAEVERAHKLVADLRKLMESSVVVEPPLETGLLEAESEADDLLSVDTDVSADVSAKLLQIDLDNERRSFDKLTGDYADLLSYRPALVAPLAECAARLAAGTSVTADIERLRSSFAEAVTAERTVLSLELENMQAELEAWESLEQTTEALNMTELAQYLQVTLSVLGTALPPLRDVQHLRSLYHLAQGHHAAFQRQDEPSDEEHLQHALETRLAEQLSELHKLEERVSAYDGVTLPEFQGLRTQAQTARAQLEQNDPLDLDTLADLWARLDKVQILLERRSTDFGGRLDSALQTLKEVAKLNSEEVTKVAALLRHLDAQRGAFEHVSAGVRDELAVSLAEVETLLDELQTQYGAARAVAGQLAGSGALGDLFGLFDAPPIPQPTAPQTTTPQTTASQTTVSQTAVSQTAAPSSIETWVAEQWISERLGEDGVQGVVLFDPQGRVLSARGFDYTDDLYEALAKLEHSTAELGAELALGALGVSVTELPTAALVGATLQAGHRLVIRVDPERLDDLLPHFRTYLDDLRDLLVQP